MQVVKKKGGGLLLLTYQKKATLTYQSHSTGKVHLNDLEEEDSQEEIN